MAWLRHLIRHMLGHTRYHEQAGEVTLRVLRAERLKRLADDAVRRARMDEDAQSFRHSHRPQ